MKRIRIVGLCLVAIFALSATAASSASAGELLFKAVTGSIVGGGFLSASGLVLLVTHTGKLIHCKDITSHGLFLSSTLGNILIRLLGCTAKEGITVNCNTAGAGTGEIHLPLTTLFHLGLAHLGINTSIPAIAVLLGPKGIELECTKLIGIKITGAVIGALQKANGEPAKLNESFKEINLVYKQTANGEQELRLILMPGGALQTYDLSTSFNGAPAELFSEKTTDTLDGFTNGAGGATEVELVEP